MELDITALRVAVLIVALQCFLIKAFEAYLCVPTK